MVVILVGLFSYLILPGLIEDQLARRLQDAFGSPTEPAVQVSSNFPPELLLGRIDRLQVTIDQGNLQGAVLYNARADLRGVSVSLPSLLQGDLAVETDSCSLRADAPPIFINENQACLNFLGLGTL